MNSIDSAPKIRAVVVGKGADYAAAEGFSDGKMIMPQVRLMTLAMRHCCLDSAVGDFFVVCTAGSVARVAQTKKSPAEQQLLCCLEIRGSAGFGRSVNSY